MNELRNLIKKEFLPALKNFGFLQYKNCLIEKPTNDLLKGFCFDSHNTRLYVHLFVQPLFIPSQFLVLSYGWRLKGSHALGEMFLLNDDQIEYTKLEIIKLMLTEKSILSETKTALDFYNKFLISDTKLLSYKTSIDMRYQESLTLTQSYIYPEKACMLVDDFLSKWENDDRKQISWMQYIKNNMLLLKQACLSKENVQIQFNDWKNFTITNLQLKLFNS